MTLGLQADVSAWNTRDKAAMVRIVRGKAGRSEVDAGQRLKRHRHFETRLREAVE